LERLRLTTCSFRTGLSALEGTGITPIITWEPELSTGGIPLSQIAAGDYDGYITASAQLAAAWKGTVFIRFAHEMNLPGSLFGNGIAGQTPADYIAAWRHVVTIFRDNGATNVQWVWSPNVYCNGQCPFTQFYPGDSYVNWVGLDGYNYGPSLNNPWTSLLNIFQGSYAAITALTKKPLMIAETASAETGGSKAAWITQGFLTDIPTYLPRVRAVVWFNRVKETDWRVNSSATSLAAWEAVVSSPLYAGNLLYSGRLHS
jgi:beta-mannanase